MTRQGPVLYVLKRFPRVSETFVLREILWLEEAGERILIDSLLPVEDGPRHPELDGLHAPVRYLPRRPRLRQPKIARAHFRAAIGAPARWIRLAVRARRLGTWRRFVQAGLVAARILQEGVRHVHAHFVTGAAEVARDAGLLAGVPVTLTAHAKDIFRADNTPQLARRVEGVAAVVTVSEYNSRYLRRRLPGVPVHLIPNGASPAQEVLPRPDGPVLCVARLVPKKGIDVLIDAFTLLAGVLPDLHAEVLGGGPLADELAQLAGKRWVADRVRFLGPRPFDEVEAAYRRASMFVLPCRVAPDGDRDGMPVALTEAAARGLPLISTEVAGIPELVQHGETGLLVPPEDPSALATAIARLALDPPLARQLGKGARALVSERFDPGKSVRLIQALFAGERS